MYRQKLLPAILISCFSLILLACGSDSSPVPTSPGPGGSVSVSESSKTNEITIMGTRDNSPICLVPLHEGAKTIGNDTVSIDISHSSDGYICVTYNGDASRTRLIITTPQNVSYTYDLTTAVTETFPLTGENGGYGIGIYEQISGNDYSVLFNETFEANISDEFSPYLYPNQYVNFDVTSQAVSLAEELAFSANTDLDVITAVYNYVISNITYDYDKAENVESTYVPDIDNILNIKKGICFDFASAMASMLRSQGIPTRLEIGYAGDVYHAWISTYIKDVGWVNGIIEFDGKDWKLMDPTFATTTSEKKLRKFIEEGDNYITKYMY